MYNIDFFYLTQNIPNSDYKIIYKLLEVQPIYGTMVIFYVKFCQFQT